MGCWPSKQGISRERAKSPKEKGFKRPDWKSEEAWDERRLQAKREEFWDTQPAYGGAKEIWDALKAVTADFNNPNNPLILESAGIMVHNNDLRATYDEKGFRYELPNYVLSEPQNLIRNKASESSPATATGGTPAQIEMSRADS